MHEPSLVLGQLQFRWISLTSEIGKIEIIARQTNRQGAHSALSAAPKTTRRKDAEFARAPGAIILIKGTPRILSYAECAISGANSGLFRGYRPWIP